MRQAVSVGSNVIVKALPVSLCKETTDGALPRMSERRITHVMRKARRRNNAAY